MSAGSSQSSVDYYPSAELVFAITCPLGANYRPVLESIRGYLRQFGYEPNDVQISDEFDDLATQLGIEKVIEGSSRLAAIWRKIGLGNSIREKTTRKDILALVAAGKIEAGREESDQPKAREKVAHLIVSLKRPEEVETLRRLYGTGFFLIGIAPTEEHIQTYLDEIGIDVDQRKEVIETDANEDLEYGQRTRDAFYLSDVFISTSDFSRQVGRFLDLVFGCPFHTPNSMERSMYFAYAASFTSGDLSRQVGAALVDAHGDFLSIGWNDVPKWNGGLYGPDDSASKRDMDLGFDSNDEEKLSMAKKIFNVVYPNGGQESSEAELRQRFKGTGFFDITEFGRAVHAEMEALLACARSGRSPRGGILYTTTFPCHNCTRHIIDAGVAQVFYIEPYAKSKAFKLLESDKFSVRVSPDLAPFGGRIVPWPSLSIDPRASSWSGSCLPAF